MRGVFDEEERKPAQARPDAELTLGSGTLLAAFIGLAAICGLCFGSGYMVGRCGSSEAAASVPPPGTPAALQASAARPKPSAIGQPGVAQAEQPAVDADAQASGQDSSQVPPASDGNLTPSSQAPQSAVQAGSSVEPNQVRPALPPAANSPLQPSPSPSAVQPALVSAAPQRAGLMVQIAAVSDPQDANVLVNALLKRGYAVIARRDAADGLIHVRIGPFNSREEANQWRQKLQSDGYNAIIQP